MILECRNLVKSFGSLQVLRNISFGLEEGTIMGLIGPNGSGKTVLLNSISGLPYSPDAGSVTYADKDIAGLKPSRICKLGIARTFQSIAYFPSLTVEQNLEVGANAVGGNGDSVRAGLEVTDLREKKDVKAEKLTLFEIKQLMIASCIAIHPKIILLDEPLAGLSESEVVRATGTIRKLRERGLTILVVEHKLRDLIDLCDKMMCLQLGAVIAEGSPRQVTSDPKVLSAYFGK